MKISAVVASVGYGSILARGLACWVAGADSVLVVTSPGDRETQGVAQDHGAAIFTTDAFTRDGDWFNKARGETEAVESGVIPWDDFGLFFDSDIVPPEDWRAQVEAVPLERGILYGAPRYDERGHYLPEQSHAGYFQLFHTQDPPARITPIRDSVTVFNGGCRGYMGYDLAFKVRWPESRRRVLDLHLTHLGERGSGVEKYYAWKRECWNAWSRARNPRLAHA